VVKAPASLSARVASYVAETTYDQLSPAVVSATKAALLDALGVMLAATSLGEGSRPFTDLVVDGGGTPNCTLLGSRTKAPPAGAAFANGALAHALDFEDAHDAAAIHPNAAAIPAALALAEASGPVSGRSLITALAIGCDLACRLALALREDPAAAGWYPPPIFGGMGAAASASRVLGLDAAQCLDAMSLALCQVTCSGELKSSPRSDVRAVRDAFPAQAAVVSALLAQRGVRGFDRPLEGDAGFFALYAHGNYDEAVMTTGLGESFEGEHLSFKPWPSCRGTHPFVDAALALREAHRLDPDEIESVVCTGAPILEMLVHPRDQKLRPATAIDAKFSLPFTTAAALSTGRVTLETFAPERLADERVLALAARVTLVTDENARGPGAASSGTLELRTRGATWTRSVLHPYGSPQRPMSSDQLIAKFLDCARLASPAPNEGSLHQLIERVMCLEESQDVGSTVMGLFNDR
jgi:2-methylcitrate dehydratase PrpD